MREVVIASAVRTAIGTFNGSLASFSAPELGSIVIKEALQRAGVSGDKVGHRTFLRRKTRQKAQSGSNHRQWRTRTF